MTLPSERLESALTTGNLWLYILTLMKSGEVYAYELNTKIMKKFGFLPEKIMMYIVLYKLEDAGLVKSHYNKRRKYYKITVKGRNELKKGKRILNKILKHIK